MRTTLTLDDDLIKKLKDVAHREGLSFKQALNEVVRRGLVARTQRTSSPPYRVTPHHGGFRPGIDPGKLNQLADQLEVEELAQTAGR